MKTKFVHVSNEIYLGSAQKEVLSSSGTISVTFKYLAIVTMSHICREDPEVRHKQQRTNKKLHAYKIQLREKQFNTDTDSNESSRQLTAARIWFSPPLQETIR